MWIAIGLIIFVLIIFVVKNQKASNSIKKSNNSYTFDIVGEQAYQRNLKKIAGSKQEESKFHECTAQVSSEPSNPYDKNAIKVEINGLLVGYISKVEAARLAGKVVNKTVPAVVNGGWKDDDTEGNYGVKLAINNPSDLV